VQGGTLRQLDLEEDAAVALELEARGHLAGEAQRVGRHQDADLLAQLAERRAPGLLAAPDAAGRRFEARGTPEAQGKRRSSVRPGGPAFQAARSGGAL
jgi:hypothetical protein